MRIILVLLFVGSMRGSSAEQTVADVFASGNEHYRAGRFEEAVKSYESILSQGYVSGPLFFNLGNAQYRAGNLAEAILAYERALRIDPGDPDARFNLKLANLRTIDRIEAVPELFLVSWMKTLGGWVSVSTTAWIFAGSWIGFFGVLSILNLKPGSSSEKLFRLAALGSLIVVVLTGGLLMIQMYESGGRSDAIITSPVVTAKASPDEQSVDTFVIHEGLKIEVGDIVGDWVRITLPDGKVGWIHHSGCERI